ncbi:TlpA family protein disulfide reductase [Singulisphaera rosea]
MGGEGLAWQAEAHLARVAEEIKDIPDGFAEGLSSGVVGPLFELRHLAPGSKAPEIDGDDLRGKPMKLSDYRGKVVVVSFWGTWCVPCMALVPEENALVAKMAGRPFVLLGVDSDEDLDKVRRIMDERGITWPSWRNMGSKAGPISTSWNVQGWPTVYVLDHRGVIRWKRPSFPHHEPIEEIVGGLVRDAERARDRRPD